MRISQLREALISVSASEKSLLSKKSG